MVKYLIENNVIKRSDNRKNIINVSIISNNNIFKNINKKKNILTVTNMYYAI